MRRARLFFLLGCVVTTLGGAFPLLAATLPEGVADQLSKAVHTCKAMAQTEGYDAVFHRDPMQPLIDAQGHPIASSGLQGGLFVQGIIWSDEHPFAIVDDELLSQGDVIGPYTILQIQPEGVAVQRAGERIFIPLDRGLETQEPPPTP